MSPPLTEPIWLEPYPDDLIAEPEAGPEARYTVRESVALAFIAALQSLPPRQRAVLILREVLDWNASEVAELLGTTVASVNSALQRARASLAARNAARNAASSAAGTRPSHPQDVQQRELLARYVAAFERYDMDALAALLHEDATWSMPPFGLWLRGHQDIRRICLGPGFACSGSILVPTLANGSPAFGQYKPDAQGGYEPWSLQVLEISGERIAVVSFFLDTTRLFPLFGLPEHLER